MIGRRRRRQLKKFAEAMRSVADEIEALSAPGVIVGQRERVAVVDIMIDFGRSAFQIAADVLRWSEPSGDVTQAAECLEATAAAWARAGPSQLKKRTWVGDVRRPASDRLRI